MSSAVLAVVAGAPVNDHDDNGAEIVVPVEISAQELAAAQAQEALVKSADKLLDKCIAAFKSGRRAMVKGYFDSGRLAIEYTAVAVKSGKKRAAALQCIEAHLVRYSDEVVNANKLMLAALAFDLVGAHGDKPDYSAVRYSDYRDHYSQLVKRVDDESAEGLTHVILPGMEAQAIALVKSLVESEADRKEVSSKVAELLREFTSQERERKEALASAARQEAEKALAGKADAQREAEEAKKALAQAIQVASVAVSEADKSAADSAAIEAARVQKEKEEAARRAERDAREAQRKREREDREAKLAKERADRQEERAERKARAEAGTGPTPLVKVMNAGTPKDVAGEFVDALRKCDSPTDIWRAMLDEMDKCAGDFDKAMNASVSAAKIALAHRANAS